MSLINGKAATLSVEYLRRVVAADLGDRFAYLDPIGVPNRMRFIAAFERLLEDGHVERVVSKPGVWSYRLSPSGKALATAADDKAKSEPAPAKKKAGAQKGKAHKPKRKRRWWKRPAEEE